MGYERKLVVAFIGAVSLVAASALNAGAQDGNSQGEDTLLQFDSMTPVTGAAVGAVNDRGIVGGGLPWAITEGGGQVDAAGNVEVEVTGLVLAPAPPVPPQLQGINPLSPFNAVVSCLTPGGVVNVATAGAPASTAGDSEIAGAVTLPAGCSQPELFVGFTRPTGQFIWFAESNAGQNSQ